MGTAARQLGYVKYGVVSGAMIGLTLLAGVQGCGRREMKMGLQAERRKEYQTAYEEYRRAARKSPSSTQAAKALARVAPSAARYWEDRARSAAAAGRQADAWAMYMKVLQIQPNHPRAVRRIAELESENARDIGVLKRRWLAEGRLAVNLTAAAQRPAEGIVAQAPSERFVSPPEEPVPDSPGDAAASAGKESLAHQQSLAAPGGLVSGQPSQQREGIEDRAVTSVGASTTSPHGAERPAGTATGQRGGDQSAGTARQRRGSEEGDRTTPTTRRSGVRGEIQRLVRRDRRPESRNAPPGDLFLTAVLSHEDARYPGKVDIIDGLSVSVKDTDSGPDVDLEFRRGGESIGEAENLHVGEAVRVAGLSGHTFEIVVLYILHQTETVRIGVRRAP